MAAPQPTAHPHFADRLASAIARAGTFACVGIDPVLDKLPPALRANHADPAQAIGTFTKGVLDAVAGVVPIVKLQAACFERHGWQGVHQLEAALAHARALGLLTILDAKRGDIGISAQHYAHAAFAHAKADALTVSPYMGPDTIVPFLDHPSTGVFVLARTSNPQSDALQALHLDAPNKPTLAQRVGAMIHDLGTAPGRTGICGLSNVGAVVAATKPADALTLRVAMPNQIFLIPGYGAQGGRPEDIRQLMRPNQGISTAGVLVTASRSVIYPIDTDPAGDWVASIRQAALRLIAELSDLARPLAF
jgi:orotidine-5'-phosphate decarboxylase